MKIKILIFAIMGIMAVILSCQKDDDSELIAMEDRIFNAYLENNNITVEPTESGLYFIQETEGSGLSPQEGNWVLIKSDLYLIDGEQLIYTSDKEKAIEYNIFDERRIYGPSKTQVGNNIEALDEGLSMMKEGGKATLLFKSDLGYGKGIRSGIGPYEPIRMDLELIKVIENPIEYENEKLADYLESNNFSNVDTMESGLIYIEMLEGEGDSAMANANVTVNVEGFLLDGRMFLDEEVFRFPLGQYSDYAVTEGLSEGVSYMKEMGKSKLIVPYYLGYGENEKTYFDGKAKVPIPPYSTLVYDVELLNAK